jgi:sugar-specific transcriptional regulator TrmB
MKRYLEGIGFSEGEEKVYLSLLKLGSSSTGNIAKFSNVSRSKIYEILEKLSKKGIVSHFKRNNVSYFRAAEPGRIIEYLDEKGARLNKEKEAFKENLPFFENLIGKKDLMREAEVFEGVEGIKTVREIALKTMSPGEIMYYFGNPASGHQNVLGYWDDWNKRRIAKKINAWIIYNQDAKEFGKRRKKLNYTKVKFLSNPGKSEAWIEIYRDTVVIALKKETPMSIVINNKLVAESFRTFFQIIWNAGLD